MLHPVGEVKTCQSPSLGPVVNINDDNNFAQSLFIFLIDSQRSNNSPPDTKVEMENLWCH